MELVLKSGLHFRSIMTCRDCSREEALDKYRDWKQNLDPAIRGFFKARVIDTVEDEMWWDGVMNFFEYPYTNGPVEGKNRLAKELRRKGAGYHNETIRMKMRANKSFRGIVSLWED